MHVQTCKLHYITVIQSGLTNTTANLLYTIHKNAETGNSYEANEWENGSMDGTHFW